MGFIRRAPSGQYYCDGHDCGYALAWFELEPDEGAEGEWVCLDCNASMYAGRPTPAPAKASGEAP